MPPKLSHLLIIAHLLRSKQNRRMLVFLLTSLSFFENVWTSTD